MHVPLKRQRQARARPDGAVARLVLTTTVVLGLCARTGLAQDSLHNPTDRPEIRLSGTVVDSDGQPIVGACVTLVAPVWKTGGFDWSENAMPRATAETETTAAGTYSVSFSPNDTRFLAEGNFSLAIYHPDHAFLFADVPLTRLQTDWPMDLALTKAQPVRVRLVDADGHALAATKITIAEQGDVTIPHAIMERFGDATDEQGWATLRNADPTRLRTIYACSDTLGIQKLTVTPIASDQFHAQSTRVTSLQGRFDVDGGRSVPGMDQLEIAVGSKPRTDPWSKPRDHSWARAQVDRDGHFTITAISEGSLRYMVRYPEGFCHRPVAGATLQETHVSADNAGQPWTICLGEAVRIRGKVLEQESGALIANIFIEGAYAELTYPFTDSRGEWSVWLSLGDVRDMYAQPVLPTRESRSQKRSELGGRRRECHLLRGIGGKRHAPH